MRHHPRRRGPAAARVAWIAGGLLLLAALLGAPATAQQPTPAPAATPATAPPSPTGPAWTGTWDTRWRGGGALLELRQAPDGKVTGAYPLYGGRIEAEAHGRELRGRWTEGDRFGRILFVMAPDGASFMGRFDTGEWWTGGRLTDRRVAAARPAVDQATPRRALRSFLTAGNRARAGDVEAWGSAAAAMDFGGADGRGDLRPGDRLAAAQALFAAVDLTTFRLWSIRGRSAQGDEVTAELPRAGTDAELRLSLRRRDGRWWIVPPDAEALEAQVRALLAARGGPAAAEETHHALRSPRDVFRALLDPRTPQPVRAAAMDLSAVREPVRDHEAALAAEYLRQVLDRIGPVLPQEVPDDPNRAEAYVHFEHPAGRIAIVRATPAAGEAPPAAGTPPRWHLSAETVAALRPLYAAFEDMPPDPEAAEGPRQATGFFALRERIRAASPRLLARVGAIEAWQALGLAGALLGGALLALLAEAAVRPLLRLAGLARDDAARLRWPLRLAVAAGLVALGVRRLGLPDVAQHAVDAAVTLVLAGAVVWGGWVAADLVAARATRRAAATSSAVDEIMVSLVAGAVKLGLVVAGLLLLADALAIPVAGVVAGLGVGGLAFAFASRETLQNVFGAGILLADRPFRRGDVIVAGDTRGTVEKVGVRSTRIRTADDSVMVVPNGKLADATINNMGSRRHRVATAKLLLGWTAEPDAVDALIEGIREIVAAQPEAAAERTVVGATGLAAEGIEVEFTCFLKVGGLAEERRVRHAILRDVLRLAHRLGLPLGAAGTVAAPAGVAAAPAAPPVPPTTAAAAPASRRAAAAE